MEYYPYFTNCKKTIFRNTNANKLEFRKNKIEYPENSFF